MRSKSVKVISALSLITTGLLAACGGGDGGSSENQTPTANTSIDASTATILADNAGNALPGCVYMNNGETAAQTPEKNVVMLYRDTIDSILAGGRNSFNRANDINTTTAGDCEDAPGSFSVVGTHADGVDRTTYTFESYCTSSDEGSSTINGTLSVVDVGTPSPTGPIPQYITASSGSSGLQITEVSSEGTFQHSSTVSNFRYDYADQSTGATQSNPTALTIGSLSINEGRDNNNFTLANVSISQYDEGSNSIVQISSLSYTDPEAGTINLNSTPLTIDDNGELLSGTITATGSDSSTLIMTPNPTVVNGFNIDVGGDRVGMMDCSTVTITL